MFLILIFGMLLQKYLLRDVDVLCFSIVTLVIYFTLLEKLNISFKIIKMNTLINCIPIYLLESVFNYDIATTEL